MEWMAGVSSDTTSHSSELFEQVGKQSLLEKYGGVKI
jgi:hypothetical protein